MATATDTTISTLNSLINTCRNGEEGYQNAAENVKDSSLKATFEKLSAQRRGYVDELQRMVVRLGGDESTASSIAGTAHRAWMALRAAVSSNDRAAMLSECERGEDVAVADFKKALETTDLHADARSLIQRQFSDVKQAHDQMKALRDSTNTN